ncbi:MAG TPA: DUF2225 domain-containing protein [Tepidimicrobium sp.]|nr:DUF2225 domain-containing protein [Tepidimicrobium sp.]
MKDELKDLYDKEVKCPICRFEFTTKKVRVSRLRLIERDADFLNHYDGENPIKYNVFVCSCCGYSALENRFGNINERDAKIIAENISPKWNSRDFGGVRTLDQAIEAYKLALLAGTLTNVTNMELGNLCLNIGWLYRLKKEKDEESRFLSMARKKFIEAFNIEPLTGTSMDSSKLSYLIGELSRRLGDKREAISWFNTCLEFSETKENPALEKLVREQWRLASTSSHIPY